MIKILLIPLLLFACSFANAETIKTDVLVIGGDPAGFAAAIQSARSKVKTLLIEPGHWLGGKITSTGGTCSMDALRNLPSGIWGEFRLKVMEHYKSQSGRDTAYNAALRFEPYAGADLLKKWSDTVKNLTVKINTPWTSIKKDGTGWEVGITVNGETVTVKAKVVVDGTADGEVAAKAGAKPAEGFDNHKSLGADLYRTSIATGDALPGEKYNDAGVTAVNYPPYPAYCIPMSAVLVKGMDNLLVTDKAFPQNAGIQYFPAQMTLGQGAGAMAAFCAFFKTTTQHLNVRVIQEEVLDYKGFLLPFTDIPQKGPHFRSIQQVCATGLLKGIQKLNGNTAEVHFEPNNAVRTEEIQPVLTEMYTRAFLWFGKEKPGAQFTVGNLLSLISDYTLTDPKTLQLSLQRAWSSQFKLTGTFDLARPVTRLEFAVLANRYLNPFAKRVDLGGRIIN